MTKQEIIDAITALAASLDAIKDSSTNREFYDAHKENVRPIKLALKEIRRA